MGRKIHKRLIAFLAVLAAVVPVSAQNKSERTDSLVRLMKATSIQTIEHGGINYRKAIDATFLHNGTYLICDTSLWNVDGKIINAWGHVKLIQDETLLTSDKMDYLIDEDLVQCRGPLVQLQNKKNNFLRTRILDYHTRDSIAVFKNGAAMRDEDGQVIESIEGTYDSRRKIFDFQRNVNMFTDSVFVKTSSLLYDSDASKANFNSYVDFWKDGNMLSADSGWYDRGRELFFFKGSVHGLSQNQEVWSDTLYFYRAVNDVELFGNAQMKDTTRNVTAVGDYMFYQDSLSRITMERNAAVAMRTEQDKNVDTLYFGADKIIYETTRMCDIPESEIANAKTRLTDMDVDPVSEYRRKAAKEAADAAAEAAKSDPNQRGKALNESMKGGKGKKASDAGEQVNSDEQVGDEQNKEQDEEQESAAPQTDTTLRKPQLDTLKTALDTLKSALDTLKTPVDTLNSQLDTLLAPSDTLAASSDSVAVEAPKDTTKIGFLHGIRNVRIFRKDIQVRCDSLVYNDLDSIARFHIDPIVWNDGNRQYTADSLFVLVRNGGADRASLMSEAFIITQEDSLAFDQIKGAEVMAYFDSTSALKRFDALGGASALFFLQENDAIATVNKVECKMLSAIMKNGELERVFYFEQPHNDAYPIAQMTRDDQRMKGFNWQPENKPSCPEDVTTLKVKPSERSAYEAHPKAVFKFTDIYFPGYMESVYKGIAARDSLKRVPKDVTPSEPVDSLENAGTVAPLDSLIKSPVDSLVTSAPKDSLALDALKDAPKDTTTAVGAPVDSLAAKDPVEVPTVDLRAQRREQREEARKLRIARRDARWAELDARDAAKAEAKKAKALEKKRESTMKAVLRKRRLDSRDEAKLQRYIKKFERAKAKEEARKPKKSPVDEQQQSEPAGKRPQGTETRRSVQTPSEQGREALGGDSLLRDNGSADDRNIFSSSGISRT